MSTQEETLASVLSARINALQTSKRHAAPDAEALRPMFKLHTGSLPISARHLGIYMDGGQITLRLPQQPFASANEATQKLVMAHDRVHVTSGNKKYISDNSYWRRQWEEADAKRPYPLVSTFIDHSTPHDPYPTSAHNLVDVQSLLFLTVDGQQKLFQLCSPPSLPKGASRWICPTAPLRTEGTALTAKNALDANIAIVADIGGAYRLLTFGDGQPNSEARLLLIKEQLAKTNPNFNPSRAIEPLAVDLSPLAPEGWPATKTSILSATGTIIDETTCNVVMGPERGLMTLQHLWTLPSLPTAHDLRHGMNLFFADASGAGRAVQASTAADVARHSRNGLLPRNLDLFVEATQLLQRMELASHEPTQPQFLLNNLPAPALEA